MELRLRRGVGDLDAAQHRRCAGHPGSEMYVAGLAARATAQGRVPCCQLSHVEKSNTRVGFREIERKQEEGFYGPLRAGLIRVFYALVENVSLFGRIGLLPAMTEQHTNISVICFSRPVH